MNEINLEDYLHMTVTEISEETGKSKTNIRIKLKALGLVAAAYIRPIKITLCETCRGITRNPKYCSKSCSAKTNNLGVQRNRPTDRTCNNCKESYNKSSANTSESFCEICAKERPLRMVEMKAGLKAKTLAEYTRLLSVEGKHPSWRHSHIRLFCRSWNKALTVLPCQYCSYSLHVELCHIKPVASFDETATLGEVNDPSNILVLCRNHHWEFDHGHLPRSAIPNRSI
jgi:hypothetical protein